MLPFGEQRAVTIIRNAIHIGVINQGLEASYLQDRNYR